MVARYQKRRQVCCSDAIITLLPYFGGGEAAEAVASVSNALARASRRLLSATFWRPCREAAESWAGRRIANKNNLPGAAPRTFRESRQAVASRACASA